MTYRSRNPQMKVVITALVLSVFFATVAQAQFLPPFNAQESAAKQYVVAMNKAQQAYYAKNKGFTSSVSHLGLRIKPDTANYKYSIDLIDPLPYRAKVAFNYAIPNQFDLRGWVGAVLLWGDKTQTILCVSLTAGGPPVSPVISISSGLGCGAGTRKISQ